MTPVDWPTERDYEWEPFCVALVEHRRPAEALQLMVPHPATGQDQAERIWRWAESQDYVNPGTSVDATSISDWTLVVELNGFQATIPGVLRRVSEGTRAVSLFRNVNAVMSFQRAVGGALIRHFDPLLYANAGQIGGSLPEEAGLDFGSPGHCVSAAFACAERLTGVHLTLPLLLHREAWLAVGHYAIASSKAEDWTF